MTDIYSRVVATVALLMAAVGMACGLIYMSHRDDPIGICWGEFGASQPARTADGAVVCYEGTLVQVHPE